MIQPEFKPKRSKSWYRWHMLPKWTLLMWVPVIVAVFLFWTYGCDWLPNPLLAFVGALVAVIFQTAAAYRANVTHFLECFSRCNKSYSDLNGRLPHLPSPNNDREAPPADADQADAIIDYFNLCAEEYLMHKMGVIPDFVWEVWREGIHGQALKKPIQEAWKTEKDKKCEYYGFDLEQLMREHHDANGRECENRDNCPLGLMIARESLAAA
jgi:hypothetical protein